MVKFHPEPEERPDKVVKVDFSTPWRRIPMMEELSKCLDEKLPEDLASKEAEVFFDEQCKKHHVDCAHPRTTSRLIDKLVGHFL